MIDLPAIRLLRRRFSNALQPALLLLMALVGPLTGFGQNLGGYETVPIKLYGNMCANGPFSVKLRGKSLSATGTDCGGYTKTPVGDNSLTVDQIWTVETISTLMPDGTQSICTTHVNFEFSGCFHLYIKIGGVWQATNVINAGAGSGSWQVLISRLPTPPAKSKSTLGSVHFSIALGTSAQGYSLGELLLGSETITPAVATRAGIASAPFVLAVDEVESISDGGGLRQVHSAAGLVDLLDAAGGGYDVRFFAPGDFGALQSGLYPLTPGAVPFATYRVRDRSDGEGEKLLLEEARPGATTNYSLYVERPGQVWVMEQGTSTGATLSPLTRTTRSPATVSGQPVYVSIDEDFTLSTTPQTTIRREFTDAASAPYTSRQQSIDQPSGRRLIYDYTAGDFDPALATFTPNPAGAYLATSETLARASGGAELVALRSTRTTTVTDENHLPHQETFAVFDGTDFVEIRATLFKYDEEGHLVERSLNGRIDYSSYWQDRVKQWEVDATGVRTDFTYWPDTYAGSAAFDPPVYTSTRNALPATGNLPEIPTLTTTYWYTQGGNGELYPYWDQRSGGGLSIDHYEYRDAEGRVYYSEESGLHAETLYEDLGDGLRRETTTRPSGGTEIRVTDAEDRLVGLSGSSAVPEYHTYTTDDQGRAVHTTYYGSATAATTNYLATTTDALGRLVKEVRPAYLTDTTAGLNIKTYYYSPTTGLLQRETATGLADRLYVYDDFGDLWRTGLDQNGDGELTLASADRVSETSAIYEQDGSDWYQVITNASAMATADTTLTPLSISRELLTLPADTLSDVSYGDGSTTLRRERVTVDRALALETRITTQPGIAQPEVSVFRAGLLQTTQASYQTAPVRHTYDGLGRTDTITDPSQGVVTDYDYDSYSDRLNQVARRSADQALALVTSFTYGEQGEAGAGQMATRTENGRTTSFGYDLAGHVTRTWGAAYPVRWEYNGLGRLEKLHTYRSAAGIDFATSDWSGGTPDTTRWTYHPSTGQLIAKTDAAAHAVRNVYYPSGLLHTRTAARTLALPVPTTPLVTTYGYTSAGELQTIDYSDATPDVAVTYHRDGRVDTVTDAAGLLTLGYDPVHFQVTGEDYSGAGLLAGRSVSRGYDSRLRPQFVATDSGYGLSYGYDVAGRLETINQGYHSATFGYAPETAILQHTVLKRTGVERLRHERGFDPLDRIDTVTTSVGGTPQVFRDYHYDSANRRDAVAQEDTRRWAFGYDDLGQVQSAQKRLADDTTPLLGYDFGYTFDRIGNRTATTVNGRAAAYTPEALNQYSQRSVPGAVDVRGEAQPAAVVTVAGLSTTRQGKDFYREVGVANGSSAANPQIAVTASVTGPPASSATETRSAFLAKTPESFSYDADGNLTQDGRWIYTWDAENRLVALETPPALALAFPALKQRLEFVYDARNRRIAKTVRSAWNGSAYAEVTATRFLYDEWNLIEEYSVNLVTGHTSVVTYYAWGLDLSDTLQGAGGVGGLLWANTPTHTFAASADANGNIVGWVNTATLAISGRADYGPFGEVAMQTGVAGNLPFGFSTKYTDKETELLYYGHRYYSPNIGRFLNRDFIEEQGGANLFALVHNAPTNEWDYLGMKAGARYTTYQAAQNAAAAEIFALTASDAKAGYTAGLAARVKTPAATTLEGINYLMALRVFMQNAGDPQYTDPKTKIQRANWGGVFGREYLTYIYQISGNDRSGSYTYSDPRRFIGKMPDAFDFVANSVHGEAGKLSASQIAAKAYIDSGVKTACRALAIIHTHNIKTVGIPTASEDLSLADRDYAQKVKLKIVAIRSNKSLDTYTP